MFRFFCPIHEVGFESADEHKVLCEITGHALATDFPKSDVWEYCCNCSTFSPSGLGKGEKARTYCFSCQNEISRRYLCYQCQTVSFECGKKSRGQKHQVATTGIEPDCPACHAVVVEPGSVVNHECDEIGSKLITARDTCPFCLEKTRIGFTLPGRDASDLGSGPVCPNCGHVYTSGSTFCPKCRYQLRNDVDLSVQGSDVERSQTLGSLCPNCSLPIPTDADFCGECGQAVVKAGVPPPPPPPPKPGGDGVQIKDTDASHANKSTKSPLPAGWANNPALLIGGAVAVGGLLLIVIVSAVISQSGNTASSNNSTYTNTNTSNARAANSMTSSVNTTNRATNSVPSNSITLQPSHPLIGKYATLSWDVAIREKPGKDMLEVGVHYKGARVRIIDVDESLLTDNGRPNRWIKVEVVRYGMSPFPENSGQEKDPDSDDVGWLPEKRDYYNAPDRKKLLRNRQMLIYEK